MGNKKLIQALALATFLGITTTVLAQITERPVLYLGNSWCQVPDLWIDFCLCKAVG